MATRCSFERWRRSTGGPAAARLEHEVARGAGDSVSRGMNPATEIAQVVLDGFNKHYRIFRETSVLAKGRFERGEWSAQREAMMTRIALYSERVRETAEQLDRRFSWARGDDALWRAIKLEYIMLLYEHRQPECAETFFNSVARRALNRRYYNNAHIFRRPALSTEHLDGAVPTYVSHYPASRDLRPTLRTVLQGLQLRSAWQDLERDVECLSAAVSRRFEGAWEVRLNFQVQVLRSLFFRNRAAYVVGRVVNDMNVYPFVVPLRLDEHKRVYVDALLLEQRELGQLFSLGRSYFLVDMEVPSAYVDFLQTLVPTKSRAELYTMVGLQKQGKTLHFRDMEQHFKHSTDRFVVAPGTRGMVMVVFTLPSFPFVFKIIRDHFAPPKDTDRAHVEERYDYVKRHDRVGRMSDSLEFLNVAFPKARFDPALLSELEQGCPSAVEVDGEHVVIEHLYSEGRLVPLDLFLQSSDEARQRDAIRDYGNALRELAAADIFPGDLLLKNFGVTRYGRVVFYDYDELTTVTSCVFRKIPAAHHEEDELASEPWYPVGPNDVFPEQFATFLFPAGPWRDLFLELHGDLCEPKFWQDQQERLRAGIQDDFFPYPAQMRFSVHPGCGR
jgi:isocitrate dehydrogenase kinase/phosphatase